MNINVFFPDFPFEVDVQLTSFTDYGLRALIYMAS
ncbi:TPA: HTH-type transcriptional repressor NsrR, partial [Klebsiella pneumoniae]|nr:HTH-type transcriptional repressor NsrR [Klebsiella pneumoniae]